MKKITVLILLIYAIAGIQAQDYQISFAGTGASTTVDSVIVENQTQCTDTILGGADILHIISPSAGINDLNKDGDNTMHIYPNPMTSTCSVDFEATVQGITTFELYDLSGKRILHLQELLTKGHHTYSLSGIGSGIFILKVESSGYSYSANIVSSNFSKGIAEIKHIETTSGIENNRNVSNTVKMVSLISDKSVIDMAYTTGDILKLTGISGVYRTIFMLVPTQTQTITFNFVECTDTISNHYSVVQIGTQMWMAENLKTTKYRNGDSIPNVTDNTQWGNLTTGAYCDYDNTQGNSIIYGKLYNWYAVADSLNLCPTGWHVPTDAEWTILTTYLGGESFAGGKLKDICKALWDSPNIDATNETGFTGLPGGYRIGNGIFDDISHSGSWWSSTESSANYAWFRYMKDYDGYVMRYGYDKDFGFSVRCVKN